jgi:hypothetical protein
MSVDEAIALVLREGYPEEDMPEDAVALMLSLHYDLSSDPAHEQIRLLIEAIHIVHQEIKGQTSIDKRLAGALYWIGSGANSARESPLSGRENSDAVDLFLAVESAFFDIDLGNERESK